MNGIVITEHKEMYVTTFSVFFFDFIHSFMLNVYTFMPCNDIKMLNKSQYIKVFGSHLITQIRAFRTVSALFCS